MLKNITSLFIVTLMLGTNAAPLLAAIPARVQSCCRGDAGCAMHTGKTLKCDMGIKPCEPHIFFAVLMAPLIKQEHNVQLTSTPVPQFIVSALVTQWIEIPRVHQADSGPNLFRAFPLII